MGTERGARCPVDVALLHGFAAGPFTWRRVIGPLQAGAPVHRVAALDRPWTGLDGSVRATLAALGGAGMERPVLMGHSAGAEIALATAAASPDRVRALVLVAPVIGGGPPPLAGALARIPGTAAFAPALLRASMRWMGPALKRAWHDRSAVTPEVVDGYRRPLLERGVAEQLWAMTKERGRGLDPRDVPDLAAPCLVVVGAADRWATPVPLGRARTVVLEDCGHMPQEERPDDVVAEVLRFLTDL